MKSMPILRFRLVWAIITTSLAALSQGLADGVFVAFLVIFQGRSTLWRRTSVISIAY
jgi:hypothetical protein